MAHHRAYQRGRQTSSDFGRHSAGLEHFDKDELQADEEDSADDAVPSSSTDPASSRAQSRAAAPPANPYADNPFQSHYYQSARALKQQNARRREMQGEADAAATRQPHSGYDAFLSTYSRQRDAVPAASSSINEAGKERSSAENTGAQSSAGEAPRPGMATGNFDAHLGRPVDPFARPGPKGYVRSDQRLQEEICECLLARPRLDISDVSVTVAEGKVMLDGSVPDRHTRFAIEDIAEDTWGVKAVDNRLRVREISGTPGMRAPGSLQ